MIDAASLTRELGGEWRGHTGSAPCPVCQPERRRDQRALSLRDGGGQLLLHCHKHRCEFQDIIGAIGPVAQFARDRITAPKPDQNRAKVDERNQIAARRLWQRSAPITGTPGEAYFRSRGIALDLPESLRWCPRILHPSGRWLLAILADVQPAGGIHRTFFETPGVRLTKAAKLMLGPCAGSSVRLSDGSGALLVGEGIESTLSAVQLLGRPGVRAWAALSTSGMKVLRLPEAAGDLIIASDGDAPGRDAAAVLAERATALGWRVSMFPAPDGRDWNDELVGRGRAA